MSDQRALRVCVFGAGAIGTVVAARLSATGQAVTVVARGKRLEEIAARGLRLRAADGSVSSATVDARTAGEPGPQDIVFIALKAMDIPLALFDLKPLIERDTRIVPLVNGIPWWYRQPGSRAPIRAVDTNGVLTATFDPDQIAGAVVYINSSLAQDGIVDVRGAERVVIGRIIKKDLPPGDPLRHLLAPCAIEASFVPDVRRDLWAKVALNLATNPLSVVAGATLEEQFHSPALVPVVAAVLEETVAVARAHGIEPRMTLAEMLAIGRKAGPVYTSMAQDYRKGAALELGAICRSVFELADQAGVPMPTARTVYELCRFKAGEAPGEP
jgi:2-dehydropantoate 2-reductase